MRCPFCGAPDSRVVDSRPVDEAIRRRRACEVCQRRFTTYEKLETRPILVVKRDGSREPFEAGKIRRGVLRACEKRPVTREQLDALVSAVETGVLASAEGEVHSQDIGEQVLARLKDIDEVAYVRFASVYRSFADVDSFMMELKRLLEDK